MKSIKKFSNCLIDLEKIEKKLYFLWKKVIDF